MCRFSFPRADDLTVPLPVAVGDLAFRQMRQKGGTDIPVAGLRMRFVADRMLGRLARWLRIIGQDVAYGQQLSGSALVSVARREKRVILTRDTHLVRRRGLPRYVFVTSDRFREQLRQVISAFELEPLAGMLTRCLDCNEELREIDRGRVRTRVPPYVWSTHERFVACLRCGRVFWGATHVDHMLVELRDLGIVPPG